MIRQKPFSKLRWSKNLIPVEYILRMALKDAAKQSVNRHLKFGVEIMILSDVCRKALKPSGLQSANFAF